MAKPRSKDARLYYRCADRRRVEAEILSKADQPTGAVYLAGYVVECMLKALNLETRPAKERSDCLKTLKNIGHNLPSLLELYRQGGGNAPPPKVVRAFTLVADWSTAIRYDPKEVPHKKPTDSSTRSTSFTNGLTGGSEMSIEIRGNSDDVLDSIKNALAPYDKERHPDAKIVLYRQNSVSIRIRVIDPAFEALPKSERHARIWDYLVKLPEETQSDISMIVLVTPKEGKQSLANLEFEQPSRSVIK